MDRGSSGPHLLFVVRTQQFLDLVQLAAVGGKILADPDVELLQFQLVVIVWRVPQFRLFFLKQRCRSACS